MIAMLKIAVGSADSEYEYNDSIEGWEGWNVSGLYKEIMEKVFFTDTRYDGYKAVIDKIKDVVEKTDDRFVPSILEELERNMDLS